jgi:hypothetical protein
MSASSPVMSARLGHAADHRGAQRRRVPSGPRQTAVIRHDVSTAASIRDVRNPGAVAQVSAFGGSSAAIARHVTVQGDLAWVSHQQDGLRVFDVSNPAAPVSLAWYGTDAATPSNRRVGGWDVIPDGNTAWLSDSADGIHAVNLEDAVTIQSARVPERAAARRLRHELAPAAARAHGRRLRADDLVADQRPLRARRARRRAPRDHRGDLVLRGLAPTRPRRSSSHRP